ncbi:MAG: PQQ-binding-like beta-propeller repeat protein, partial [Thermodesulfobacteriota bacterium]
VGGRVYVGGHDGYVYALDGATGEMLWEFPTRGRVGSTPAVHGDRVFVGSSDGYLYALRAGDGSVAWKTPSGRGTFRHLSYGGIRSSPAVALGLVLAGGCDGRVRALDERTGALRWILDGGTEGVYSSPALAGETLFVGTDGLRQSALLAVDARTGTVLWRFPTSTQIFSTPAVAGGAVYFHARNDHVYALRAEDGGLLWKTPAPSLQSEAAAFQDMAKSSPAVAEAAVYVGVDRELVALDRETGRVLWRTPTQGRVDSSPLVVGSTVYVGSDDRSVYGLDAGTGAVRWTYATGARVSVSPSAAHGLLLIGSNDGSLYAFGSPGRSAPDAP